MGRGGKLPYKQVIYGIEEWGKLFRGDDTYFKYDRYNIFHYAVFVNEYETDAFFSKSGYGEFGGDYFLIANVDWKANAPIFDSSSKAVRQASIFMHELGHNL